MRVRHGSGISANINMIRLSRYFTSSTYSILAGLYEVDGGSTVEGYSGSAPLYAVPLKPFAINTLQWGKSSHTFLKIPWR